MATHLAREWVSEDGQRECRVCGRAIVGMGPDLRHRGETARFARPVDPDDMTAYSRAVRRATDALAQRQATVVPDEDAARLVVGALLEDGLLRRRPTRKRPLASA